MKNNTSKSLFQKGAFIKNSTDHESLLALFILKMKWVCHRLCQKMNYRFALLNKLIRWLLLLSFFITVFIYLSLLFVHALHSTHQ